MSYKCRFLTHCVEQRCWRVACPKGYEKGRRQRKEEDRGIDRAAASFGVIRLHQCFSSECPYNNISIPPIFKTWGGDLFMHLTRRYGHYENLNFRNMKNWEIDFPRMGHFKTHRHFANRIFEGFQNPIHLIPEIWLAESLKYSEYCPSSHTDTSYEFTHT